MIADVAKLQAAFAAHGYRASEDLATALYLAAKLEKPLLIEGHAGVGKTDAARVLSETLGTELIRLQCYEGIDAMAALYEWDHMRQWLELKLHQEGILTGAFDLYDTRFLLERPLLAALRRERAPVLLIDEVDRADEAFEAFLLEVLSDFAVSIPELGTLRATVRPRVILTSNRVRELSDALKRRCLYAWLDYPSPEEELEILRLRLPGVGEQLARRICRFVAELRELPLVKAPGVAETLDWARALLFMQEAEVGTAAQAGELSPELARATLSCLLKQRADLARVEATLGEMLP